MAYILSYTGKIYLKVTDSFGLFDISEAGVNTTITDLWPINYPLVGARRVGRTLWEYEFQFNMENRGNGDATNVVAVLSNWPANVTVIDETVSWPAIPATQTVTSFDTFKLRINRRIRVTNSTLTWTLTFDDASGKQQKLVNFPLFP